MKVFVSWSGVASHEVAKAIKDWLPNVIQSVDVFLSSEDIAKGEQWFTSLGEVLEESHFGILCLTRANLAAPWILYEAGALSKSFEQARIVPLLIDLKVEDVKPPLASFNASLLEQSELQKMVAAINDANDEKLSEKQLTAAFKAQWPDFDTALKAAAAKAAAASPYLYDVFLSAPMAAYKTDDEYIPARAEIEKLYIALTQTCGLRVYWAAEKIKKIDDFDNFDDSAMDDLQALQVSRTFALVYPKPMTTSALFEAGYALALKLPCHYWVRDRDDLPYLMKELAGFKGATVKIHEQGEWQDYDELAEKMCKSGKKWFGAGSA
ncbi:MAG TPA: TIR domain-containing protein [Steroidobacteraceae bacterium]|nr:TIR domain-containing protein [Steroidobacteraceae bacterium]